MTGDEFFGGEHAGGFHGQHNRPDHSWLTESASRDNWGFGDSLAVVQNNPLVFANLPTHMARQWNVQLTAMRYRGTQSGGIGLQTTLPGTPDNQVFPVGGLTVLVQWGIGGVTERAVIDYPWSGCSFDVFGSNIRVAMNLSQTQIAGLGNAAAVPPIVGAMLSPNVGRYAQRMVGAQLTAAQVVVPAAGTTVYVPVPARARTYRIIDGNGNNHVWNTTFYVGEFQSNGTGFPSLITQDQISGAFGLVAGGENVAGGAANPGMVLAKQVGTQRMLESGAEFLGITQGTDAVATMNVIVVFGLDLG